MGKKHRKKITCSKCRRSQPSENAVWTHIAFQHPSSGGDSDTGPKICPLFACSGCDNRFTSEADLIAHIDNANNAEQTESENKDTTPEDNKKAATERAEVTSKDKNIDVENKNEEKEVEKEISKCSSFKFYCALCRKKFETENALLTHIAFKHVRQADNLTPKFICDNCKQVFDNVDAVTSHCHDNDDANIGDTININKSNSNNDNLVNDIEKSNVLSDDSPVPASDFDIKDASIRSSSPKPYGEDKEDSFEGQEGIQVVYDKNNENDDFDDFEDQEYSKIDDIIEETSENENSSNKDSHHEKDRAEEIPDSKDRVSNLVSSTPDIIEEMPDKSIEDAISEDDEVDNNEEENNQDLDTSTSSKDLSLSDLLDDEEGFNNKVLLFSTMLTNEVLTSRVRTLEDKVVELQEYMNRLLQEEDFPYPSIQAFIVHRIIDSFSQKNVFIMAENWFNLSGYYLIGFECKNQESIESSSIPSIPIDTHCENNDEQTDMSCSSSPSNSQSISTSRAVMTSQDDAIQCDKIESTTSSYDRLSLPSETSSYDRLSLLPAPVDVASEEFDQVITFLDDSSVCGEVEINTSSSEDTNMINVERDGETDIYTTPNNHGTFKSKLQEEKETLDADSSQQFHTNTKGILIGQSESLGLMIDDSSAGSNLDTMATILEVAAAAGNASSQGVTCIPGDSQEEVGCMEVDTLDVGSCMQDEEEGPFDSVVLDQIRNGCISSVTELDSLFTSVIQSHSQDDVGSLVESPPKLIYLNPALEKENQDLEAAPPSSRKLEAAAAAGQGIQLPTKKQLEQEDNLCTTTTPTKAAIMKPLLNGDTMHLTHDVNNEDKVESNSAAAAVKRLQTKSLNGLDPPGLTASKHRQAAA